MYRDQYVIQRLRPCVLTSCPPSRTRFARHPIRRICSTASPSACTCLNVHRTGADHRPTTYHAPGEQDHALRRAGGQLHGPQDAFRGAAPDHRPYHSTVEGRDGPPRQFAAALRELQRDQGQPGYGVPGCAAGAGLVGESNKPTDLLCSDQTVVVHRQFAIHSRPGAVVCHGLSILDHEILAAAYFHLPLMVADLLWNTTPGHSIAVPCSVVPDIHRAQTLTL